MATSPRAERLARGWIVGLVATTVAAVSHSLAGGYRPGVLSFTAALIFAGMLGTAVMSRRLSLPRLAIAVGGAQLAFHLVFSMLGTGATMTAQQGDGMPGMAGMAGMSGMQFSAVSAPMTMSAHDHLTDPGMWLAHAVAALVTVLFLRHAELALWKTLSRASQRMIRRLVFVAELPQHPHRVVVTSRDDVPLVSRILVTSARRRGPPLLAF